MNEVLSVMQLLAAWGHGVRAALERWSRGSIGDCGQLPAPTSGAVAVSATKPSSPLSLSTKPTSVSSINRNRFNSRTAHTFSGSPPASCVLFWWKHARTRHASKRGGDACPVTLDEAWLIAPPSALHPPSGSSWWNVPCRRRESSQADSPHRSSRFHPVSEGIH